MRKNYRYQPAKKSIKIDCPDCSPENRKTFRRYVDTRTGDLLPEQYGICDRVNSCRYWLSPYDKGTSGISYAEVIFQQWRANNPLLDTKRAVFHDQRRVTTSKPVCAIPQEVMQQSMRHYERNQLAVLLKAHFDPETDMAEKLLQQFQIGTSSHWPGACIFWFIDDQGRVRGGQIKLLGEDGHTVKYVDRYGVKCSKTNWVHTVLKRRLEKAGKASPEWLQNYEQHGEVAPCLFGLPQLQTAPTDKPIAIVEAPKTAIIAAGHFPEFVWLAVGAKSYLTAERLAPLKNRSLLLWPDLDAYTDVRNSQGKSIPGWLSKAALLREQGFDIEVSNFLEQHANEKQKMAGLDLADFLLAAPSSHHEQLISNEEPKIVTTSIDWAANPGSVLRPDISQLTYL